MNSVIEKKTVDNLVIKPCTGTKTLMKAASTFQAGIDYGSGSWDCHKTEHSTSETLFDIWTLKQASTFGQLFYSIASSI